MDSSSVLAFGLVEPANISSAFSTVSRILLMAEGYAARYRGADTFDFDTVMDDFQKNIAILRKNFYKEEYLK